MSDAQYSTDEAKKSPGQMAVDQLDKFLYEIRLQPNWRATRTWIASTTTATSSTTHAGRHAALGMAPLIRNLIRPTIDVALGMEAKTRSDWRVQADDDEYQDVAEALSVKLKEAERESRADRACSDAYAGQLKSGLGWVEVSARWTRSSIRTGYRVCRREIFWDWRAKEPDLSDARYLVRRRWQDVDILELMFPDQKELIGGLGWSKANWDTPLTDLAAIRARLADTSAT
jgi:hypothetical protein